MDISDDAIYELLRSSRERIRQCREIEQDLDTALLITQQLIRETLVMLHDGRDAAILKFRRSPNLPGIDPSPIPAEPHVAPLPLP